MVIENKLLKNIVAEFPKENIVNWNHLEVTENHRIYYKVIDNENKSGFYFYTLESISYPSGENWNIDETEVECMYNGIAYFDGIRHLYMGDEFTNNEGYDYYPNLDLHIKVLEGLSILENNYCNKE